MKKQIFSGRLLYEGLRQTLVFGIVSAALMLISSFLSPLFRLYYTAVLNPLFENNGCLTNISAPSACSKLFLVPYVMTPLMTIYLFGFLNKRNSSDFYHSLPYTRTCILISYSSAIAIWSAALIIFPTIITCIFALLLKQYIVISISGILAIALNLLVSSLTIMSAVLVGVSITGNSFSTVVASILIIYAPRIFISGFYGLSNHMNPMFSSKTSMFFSGSANLITSPLTWLFNTDGSISVFHFKPLSLIYTALLGIAYFILAKKLFNSRNSETAENCAIGRKTQAAFRITVTMFPCFFICFYIAYCIAKNTEIYWTGCFIVYYVAVLIYYLYEIVSTKKFNTFFKTSCGLIAVAVLNIAFIAGFLVYYNFEKSFLPDANDIISVTPVSSNEFSDNDITISEMVDKRSEKVKIKSDTLNELLAASLKDSSKSINDPSYNEDASYEGSDPYSESADGSGYTSYTFRIKTKHGTKVRNIPIKLTDLPKLFGSMMDNEEYRNLWRDPIDPINGTIRISSNTGYSQLTYLSDEEKVDIFNSYCNELKKININEYAESFRNKADDYYADETTSENEDSDEPNYVINYFTKYDHETCSVNIDISQKMFPETYQKISDLGSGVDKRRILKLKKLADNDFNNYDLKIVNITYNRYENSSESEPGYSSYRYSPKSKKDNQENVKVIKEVLALTESRNYEPKNEPGYDYFDINILFKQKGIGSKNYEMIDVSLKAIDIDINALPEYFSKN